jgi:SAM-dependent methyltransferase
MRLRRREPAAAKHDAELRWWLEHWNPVIEQGGFNPGDVPGFLDPGEEVAGDYAGRRWQIARAEVRRVLSEAAVEDAAFFDGRVVVDIGPGPLGFPDACPARVCIGVDPLAERYREAGLLLEGSPAIYLTAGAEAVPLLSASADVVVARNSLDHVDDPEAALAEIQRLLRPGGTLIANFDVGHPPTPTEPHTLTRERVLAGLPAMTVRRELRVGGHGGGGTALVLVATRA